MNLQDRQQARVEELKREAERKSRDFVDIFDNDAGKRVLEELRKQFGGFVVTEDIHTTVVKAAQRDVVLWIEELIKRGKDYAVER